MMEVANDSKIEGERGVRRIQDRSILWCWRTQLGTPIFWSRL